jgi:DNA polymerase
MPKRYWRNLPEAALIPELLASAPARTRTMLQSAPAVPRKRIRPVPAEVLPERPQSLAALARLAGACTRCPLHEPATRTVFGEGPEDAPVVLVGEQPGDEEDLAGRPFVGPAGRQLDQALAAAGIEQGRVYLTNAVKHFKFSLRGKRRIHQKPGGYEIEHCRWWLEQELALVRPRLTVALGATAASALLGRPAAVMRERGRPLSFQDGLAVLITAGCRGQNARARALRRRS